MEITPVIPGSFTTALAGLVPASGGGSTNFLRADGTWAVPISTTAAFSVTAAGTGSSQGITLPQAVNAGDVFVFVNGVYQTPTTHYTVSSTTLTITTESSGDNIIIVKPSGLVKGANDVLGFTYGVTGKTIASEKYPTLARYAFTATTGNCSAKAGTAATASTVFTIKKNGSTTVGTFTFAAAGTTATPSITAGSISAGDLITIEAPTTPDTTLADIAFTVSQ